jgi:hypothetical protein
VQCDSTARIGDHFLQPPEARRNSSAQRCPAHLEQRDFYMSERTDVQKRVSRPAKPMGMRVVIDLPVNGLSIE